MFKTFELNLETKHEKHHHMAKFISPKTKHCYHIILIIHALNFQLAGKNILINKHLLFMGPI